jgi:hypothetical protein
MGGYSGKASTIFELLSWGFGSAWFVWTLIILRKDPILHPMPIYTYPNPRHVLNQRFSFNLQRISTHLWRI